MRYESQNDYLMHYRTKGSKNGVRRYQNEDGSLTAEGRDHSGVGDPRRVGGLHDKQGNKVSVGANIKAGYKNTKGVAKAAFKMLFKKKNNRPEARGISAKQTDSSASDTQPQKPKKMNKQNNRDRAKKIVAAVAATSLAAVTAYAVAKKATKMRDDYRAKAKDKASDNFWANIQASRIHLHAIDEVMLDRKDPKRKDTPDWLKTSHIQEARRSAILRDTTKREYEKNKKISETATRRDAVKNYVSEKRKQRANEKAYRKNSIEARLKNTSRR